LVGIVYERLNSANASKKASMFFSGTFGGTSHPEERMKLAKLFVD
jgi:hypothetical protein